MLINTSKQLLIWTPYKSYSTSFHHHFRGYNGWLGVVGAHTMMPHMHGPHTNSYQGPTSVDLVRILPLRNPFNRVRSMYKFSQRDQTPEKKLTFTEWFETFGVLPLNGSAVSQYEHEEVIRVETLAEDLSKFGIDAKDFPHENKSNEESKILLTDDQKTVIRYIHRKDFEKGNYSFKDI